jgi:mRNA-degrading endonuclease RelE of RelBE toxin-antitoxin system
MKFLVKNSKCTLEEYRKSALRGGGRLAAGLLFLSVFLAATILPMPFEVRYSSIAAKQLKRLRAFDRATIFDEIERTLTINPTMQSKSKVKKLRQPAPTQYRLRVEDFSVFYDIDDANYFVNVVQILSKEDSLPYLESFHED